jgi:hypothetical protein
MSVTISLNVTRVVSVDAHIEHTVSANIGPLHSVSVEAPVRVTTAAVVDHARGPRGVPGPLGPSAYEVWLGLGNTGSEEDFLASTASTPAPLSYYLDPGAMVDGNLITYRANDGKLSSREPYGSGPGVNINGTALTLAIETLFDIP